MIFSKSIQDYCIKRHRGFFTVERKYIYRFFGYTYKEVWRPVEEMRTSKTFRIPIMLPKHFTTEKLARSFVQNEVEKKIANANKKLAKINR